MLFKVRVQEVLTHEVLVEADTEEDAMLNWEQRFGDADFDEIVAEGADFVDIEEAE